jgi:hypothetical protein
MAYTKKLKAFFMQNDPDRLYLAKKISKAFRHDEDAVMKRLEEIYASGGPKNLTFKELAKPSKKLVENINADSNLNEETSSEDVLAEPVKKKGKLKKIIILILSISVLGGGGYFGYNMFLASDHDESSHSEEVHESDGHGESHDEHSTDHAEPVNDSVISDIESKIEAAEAEKDSTIEDIKDAAEALHVLGL